MKTLNVMILSLALCGLLFMSAYASDFYLEWNAGVLLPHHEAVVGDSVARYRLQATPTYEFNYGKYSLQVDAWGVQKWQPSSVVGHFPESYENSDWSVEKVRVSTKHRLKLGADKLHLFVEYYMPLNRRQWGGHGMERHYYLLAGVGGTFGAGQ